MTTVNGVPDWLTGVCVPHWVQRREVSFSRWSGQSSGSLGWCSDWPRFTGGSIMNISAFLMTHSCHTSILEVGNLAGVCLQLTQHIASTAAYTSTVWTKLSSQQALTTLTHALPAIYALSKHEMLKCPVQLATCSPESQIWHRHDQPIFESMMIHKLRWYHSYWSHKCAGWCVKVTLLLWDLLTPFYTDRARQQVADRYRQRKDETERKRGREERFRDGDRSKSGW